MKHTKQYLIFVILITVLLCSACDTADNGQQSTDQRGNSDTNILNLGLTAQNDESTFTVGTKNGYDLIFEVDEEGNLDKAIGGLSGYIQYLNIINDTCYFLGITCDRNGQRKEAIFSMDLNGKNQNCICDIPENTTVTYLSAVGDLLIFATETAEGKATVQAILPEKMTDAILLEENRPIRSLQIKNGRVYFISDNILYSADMDGTDKKKIFKSSSRISNMVISDDLFYLVQGDKNDRIIAVNNKGEIINEIYRDGKHIAHMNVYKSDLIFADHDTDQEGELKEAVIYRQNIRTGERNVLTRIDREYTGIEVCADRVFLHRNDEHLTLTAIDLP